MDENDLMTFGKYLGKPLKDVPAGYFQYLYDKGIISIHKWNKIYHYANDKGLIETEVKGNKKDG